MYVGILTKARNQSQYLLNRNLDILLKEQQSRMSKQRTWNGLQTYLDKMNAEGTLTSHNDSVAGI
jgi:hypothetical protein